MKKILLILLLSVSFVVYAAPGSWTGYISDSDCGAKGDKADHAACAAKCIKNGALPVLVVNDKVYNIADTAKVMPFVGKKVTITGTLDGETLKVDKIAASK